MERNIAYDATAHVRWSTETGAFDPKLYGYKQTKRVEVNLRDIHPSFIPFIHVQVVDFALYGEPSEIANMPWAVNTESAQTAPAYGVGLYAVWEGNLVNFKAQFEHQADWVEAYYRKTLPLVDVRTEIKAPDPTHFQVIRKGVTTEWSIEDWNQNLDIGSLSKEAKETVTIRWIKKTATTSMILSIGAVMILPKTI
jgi:hypothetical protein